MYTIDTKSNDNYFIVLKDNKEFMRIAKKTNSIKTIANFIGNDKIKEII